MDGLSRAAGVGPTITLSGHTLSVKGRILRHYGEIEAEIIKRRGNPLTWFRNAKTEIGNDPAMLRVLAETAFDKGKDYAVVTRAEISRWLDTQSGACFQVWLAVRDNDREKWTLEAVTRVYCDDLEDAIRKAGDKPGAGSAAYEARKQEIDDAINQASGEDPLGN